MLKCVFFGQAKDGVQTKVFNAYWHLQRLQPIMDRRNRITSCSHLYRIIAYLQLCWQHRSLVLFSHICKELTLASAFPRSSFYSVLWLCNVPCTFLVGFSHSQNSGFGNLYLAKCGRQTWITVPQDARTIQSVNMNIKSGFISKHSVMTRNNAG